MLGEGIAARRLSPGLALGLLEGLRQLFCMTEGCLPSLGTASY